jgi:hypothetical protein
MVSIRASGKRACNSKTWAWYGAMMRMSARVTRCSSLSRLIEVGFVAMTYSASFGHMPAGKAEGSDRFLEILGSAERDLLTGLDLDGFAGRRVASHTGGAMPDLQDAQAHQA